jgi:uncharacterized protein (DUF1800 family)
MAVPQGEEIPMSVHVGFRKLKARHLAALGFSMLICGSALAAPYLGPDTTRADAARLVAQASFGPTFALPAGSAGDEVTRVAKLGVTAYLNEQFAATPTHYVGFAYVSETPASTCQPGTTCYRDNYSSFQIQRQFFQNAVAAPDQLRQRVAYALSQLLVVSANKTPRAYGMQDYQNLLIDNAFGNYKDLLTQVTLHPVMGRYLDMVNNDKGNAATGTKPNENYARELLQLFSIGLYKLNLDGSIDMSGGAPQPTNDLAVVDGFAAALTGWTYPTVAGAKPATGHNPVNYAGQMEPRPALHDSASVKPLLNGASIPGGGTPAADLATAIANVFNHPNVGPFVSKRLILALVTSNPSAAYVARVAGVFNDDGTPQHVRGNLQAVVTAILTDAEARGDASADPQFGHLRDHGLFLAAAMRALVGGQAGSTGLNDGVYLRAVSSNLGQDIYDPPSVFNFYPPSYPLPGGSPGTIGPEFAILDAATMVNRINTVQRLLYGGIVAADATVTGSTGTRADLSALASIANQGGNAAVLVDTIGTALVGGWVSSTNAPAARSTILGAVNAVPATNATGRVQLALYLILASGQYQAER